MKTKSKPKIATKAVKAAVRINLYFNPLTGPLVYVEDADVSRPGRVKFKIRPTAYKGIRGYNTLRKALTRRHGAPDTGSGGSEGQTGVGWYVETDHEFEVEWTGEEIVVTWTDRTGLPELPTSELTSPEPKEAKPAHSADIEAATAFVNRTVSGLAQGPLVKADDATIVSPGRIRVKISPERFRGIRGYTTLRNRVKHSLGFAPNSQGADSDGNESVGWILDNGRELWVEWEAKEISVLVIDRVVANAARPKRTKVVADSADVQMLRFLCGNVLLTLEAAKKFATKLDEKDQQAGRDLFSKLTDDFLKGTS